MTATLAEQLADEETTPGEVAPRLSPLPAAERQYPCPDCDEVFTGGWGAAKRGTHRARVHGYVKPAGGRSKAGPAKRKRSTTKVPAKAGPSAPGKPKAVPATPVVRRQPAAELITMLLTGAAGLVAKVDPPVGAMLGYEAPVAGPVLDRSFAGTPVDKFFLQPATRGMERFEEAAMLALPPSAIAILERYPQAAPALMPQLRAAVRAMLPQLLAAMKAEKAKEAETELVVQDMAELDPEFAAMLTAYDPQGNRIDPVDVFLSRLLPAPADAPADESAATA